MVKISNFVSGRYPRKTSAYILGGRVVLVDAFWLSGRGQKMACIHSTSFCNKNDQIEYIKSHFGQSPVMMILSYHNIIQ